MQKEWSAHSRYLAVQATVKAEGQGRVEWEGPREVWLHYPATSKKTSKKQSLFYGSKEHLIALDSFQSSVNKQHIARRAESPCHSSIQGSKSCVKQQTTYKNSWNMSQWNVEAMLCRDTWIGRSWNMAAALIHHAIIGGHVRLTIEGMRYVLQRHLNSIQEDHNESKVAA